MNRSPYEFRIWIPFELDSCYTEFMVPYDVRSAYPTAVSVWEGSTMADNIDIRETVDRLVTISRLMEDGSLTTAEFTTLRAWHMQRLYESMKPAQSPQTVVLWCASMGLSYIGCIGLYRRLMPTASLVEARDIVQNLGITRDTNPIHSPTRS